MKREIRPHEEGVYWVKNTKQRRWFLAWLKDGRVTLADTENPLEDYRKPRKLSEFSEDGKWQWYGPLRHPAHEIDSHTFVLSEATVDEIEQEDMASATLHVRFADGRSRTYTDVVPYEVADRLLKAIWGWEKMDEELANK